MFFIVTILALASPLASFGQTPVAPPQKSAAKPPTVSAPPGEMNAWQAAVKNGASTAYRVFYLKYPRSTRLKIVKGTIRGRYWYRMDDEQHRDGVLVTVEGMNVLASVPLKEALELSIVSSRPLKLYDSYKAKAVTFNWQFIEIVDGGLPPVSTKEGEDPQLILPTDYANASIVLSADGKRLLTWDISAAEPVAQPTKERTFIDVAASNPAFSDPPGPKGAWQLDKTKTPSSQEATVSGTRMK